MFKFLIVWYVKKVQCEWKNIKRFEKIWFKYLLPCRLADAEPSSVEKENQICRKFCVISESVFRRFSFILIYCSCSRVGTSRKLFIGLIRMHLDRYYCYLIKLFHVKNSFSKPCNCRNPSVIVQQSNVVLTFFQYRHIL